MYVTCMKGEMFVGRYMDLFGDKYGRLTPLYRVKTEKKMTLWHCRCDCGNEVNVQIGHLRDGHTQSCGCLHSEQLVKSNTKHNLSGTRLYNIWSNMKSRCDDANDPKYKNYGARGVKVCNEWYEASVFFDWARQSGYSDDLTLDRIDVNGNYEPDNCRWVDYKTQSLNRTDNHYLTHNGKTQTMKEWSDECNIPYKVLEARINRYHWSVERALKNDI